MGWLLSSSIVQGGFCLVVICSRLHNLWHGAHTLVGVKVQLLIFLGELPSGCGVQTLL